MNLRSLANGLTSRVSPNTEVIWRRSTGSVQDPVTKRRTPGYEDVAIIAQVQALTSTDLRFTQNLNEQGYNRSVYLNGQALGALRLELKGGDLMLFGGQTWKVVSVPENWPQNGWGKVIVTLRQTNEAQLPD